jgi:6-pyruvoyltetrahydropterin/6-carboxytetrahydropterin synthase
VIAVTRRYRFPAAHVLASAALSDAENQRIFGKCANPNGHGHDYGVEITVSGPVDPETGSVLAPERLDAAFDERVRRPFSHHLLNDCEAFRGLVPTAENIARVVHRALRPALEASGVRLVRVRIVETPRNTFDYGDA